MTRSLSVLLTLVFAANAAAAEVRPRTIPMDRVPCELAEARLIAPTEWFDAPHISIDHPYWWTLTDEITPAELRDRLQRRVTAERQRVQAEIERRAAGASSNEPRRSWEVRGRETPELFPVWSEFDSLALSHHNRRDKEYTLQDLIGFGISPEAAHQIVLAAEERSGSSDVKLQVSEAQQRFRELRSRAEEEIGTEGLWVMMRRNDFAHFSELVGWSQESLHDLVRVAYCNWRAALSVPVLVELREEVGEQQWDLFRRYLLENYASTTTEY